MHAKKLTNDSSSVSTHIPSWPLKSVLPRPRVWAPINATASVQVKPSLVMKTSSTSVQLEAPGRRMADSSHDSASTLPYMKVLFKSSSLLLVSRITALAEAIQKSAYFVSRKKEKGKKSHELPKAKLPLPIERTLLI